MRTRATVRIDRGRAGRRRSAFTLIEVLVVVAIIALLIAILLPALSRAKEVSRRSVCGSQQHQLGIAIQLYAASFKGSIPIGCYGPDGQDILSQSNYIIWNRNNYQSMGLVVQGRFIPDHKVFYCPSGRPEFGLYNTPGNLWLTAGTVTRMGYAMRPEVAFDGPNTTGYPAWKLTDPHPFYTKKPKNQVPYPRIDHYKGKVAVLADISSSWPHKNVHLDGFNVSFCDGSARWGGLFKVKKLLSSMTANYRAEYNAYQGQMWRLFDKF